MKKNNVLEAAAIEEGKGIDEDEEDVVDMDDFMDDVQKS